MKGKFFLNLLILSIVVMGLTALIVDRPVEETGRGAYGWFNWLAGLLVGNYAIGFFGRLLWIPIEWGWNRLTNRGKAK